jgi:hypothetical protein
MTSVHIVATMTLDYIASDLVTIVAVDTIVVFYSLGCPANVSARDVV